MMMPLCASSQKTYPSLMIVDGDTVVVLSRAQAREVNTNYATVEYQSGQIERYKILIDTLDQRVFTWQKIADLRMEQYRNEKMKGPIYEAEIKVLKRQKIGWKVVAIDATAHEGTSSHGTR